jgi:mannose-binding lectin
MEAPMAVTFNVPANTQFGLIVVCNSAYYQRATITPSGGSPITLSKSTPGASPNLEISSKAQTFSTGSTGEITVDIQYSTDNKTWQESTLSPASLGFAGPKTFMWVVGSEDADDNDYNDTIVIINSPVG